MNPTLIYAIAAGGIVVVLIIIKSFVSVEQVLRALALLAAKHFTYSTPVKRKQATAMRDLPDKTKYYYWPKTSRDEVILR